MRRVAFAIALGLGSCEAASDPRDAEIAALRSEVEALRSATTDIQDIQPSQPSSSSTASVELIVNYPSGSMAGLRKEYADAEACERAKRTVLDEYDRREADNQAQVGTINEAGHRIVAVGSLERPSVVCLGG